MLNLVNIIIEDDTGFDNKIDSMIILDSKKNIKDIFEYLMEDIKYEYDSSTLIIFTMILWSADDQMVQSKHIYKFKMNEEYNFESVGNILNNKYSHRIPN